MKIEHIAIWVENLETMKTFYLRYFDATCGEKYTNPNKNYTSYFLTFPNADCRIELMHRPDIDLLLTRRGMTMGWAHLSITLGSKERVHQITHQMRIDGCTIIGEPRISGDGYYESVIADPEGNYIELLA